MAVAKPTRVCHRCGREQSLLAGFHRHANGRDGYDVTCKGCRKRRRAERAIQRSAESKDALRRSQEDEKRRIAMIDQWMAEASRA